MDIDRYTSIFVQVNFILKSQFSNILSRILHGAQRFLKVPMFDKKYGEIKHIYLSFI